MGKKRGQRSILLRVLILGVCAYFTVTLSMLWKSLSESKEQLSLLEQQYAAEQNDIEELKAILNSEDNSDIIEKAARERLGYIYSDEQIFIDISGN